MKSHRAHWMRTGLTALAFAMTAGTVALAYERASDKPRAVVFAGEEADMGIDFIVTGPSKSGVAEPVAARISSSADEKPALRHRMRKN